MGCPTPYYNLQLVKSAYPIRMKLHASSSSSCYTHIVTLDIFPIVYRNIKGINAGIQVQIIMCASISSVSVISF